MAAKSFTVSHGGIALKVTLRDTVEDVHQAYKANSCPGTRYSNGQRVHAFFVPTQSASAKHVGGIVLPLAGGNLGELVPHEVTHAVLHKVRVVAAVDDEGYATAVGRLSALIFRRLRTMGVAL